MWFGDLGSEIWFKGMGIAPSSIGACMASTRSRRGSKLLCTGLIARHFVLARVVSATPPSIAIVALVLGGPERVRVVLSSSSQARTHAREMRTRRERQIGRWSYPCLGGAAGEESGRGGRT